MSGPRGFLSLGNIRFIFSDFDVCVCAFFSIFAGHGIVILEKTDVVRLGLRH